MKRIFSIFLAVAVVAGVAAAFLPVATKAADPNLTGTWLLVLNYKGNIQMHDMTITSQNQNGSLSGTGGYPHNEAYSITWSLGKSQVRGGDVKMTIKYNNSDYIAQLVGAVQPDHTITGNWQDNRGLTGTWSATPKEKSQNPGGGTP
ncbi:MAG TPA: hypothetical protein VK254_03010 [Candidatus Bathyarchaeia archaeon]|nr:hypothetical protein [Candidatus Bathyarchaeia archaeon]